jgi:hypothetical protein
MVAGELRTASHRLPPLNIAQYDGGPPTCRVGRPRSGSEFKAKLGRWAKLDEINTNNLPLDLILYFKLYT